jgi:hypothetical protein
VAISLEVGEEASLLVGGGEGAPVLVLDGQPDLAMDDLDGLLESLAEEGGAQSGVALEDSEPGTLEGVLVERSDEGAAELDDVDPGLWSVEAVEEHPLLQWCQRVDVLDSLHIHLVFTSTLA